MSQGAKGALEELKRGWCDVNQFEFCKDEFQVPGSRVAIPRSRCGSQKASRDSDQGFLSSLQQTVTVWGHEDLPRRSSGF